MSGSWEDLMIERLRDASVKAWTGQPVTDDLEHVRDDIKFVAEECRGERGRLPDPARLRLLNAIDSRVDSAIRWVHEQRSYGRAKEDISQAIDLFQQMKIRFCENGE